MASLGTNCLGFNSFHSPSQRSTFFMYSALPSKFVRRARIAHSESLSLNNYCSRSVKKMLLKGHEHAKITESSMTTTEKHQNDTRLALREDLDLISAMEMIDTLELLGIAYHYDEEINSWLDRLSKWDAGESLHATSLRFRLLRQNGRKVSCDDFEKFTINKDTFSKDTVGLLSLYEASKLGANGEDVLLDAGDFAETQLRQLLRDDASLPKHFSWRVSRSLDFPMQLRMDRLKFKLCIENHTKLTSHSSNLLEQARSDYDGVQLLNKMELHEITRWWKELGLVEKLSFARDRPAEWLLWAVGIFPEPKYSTVRIQTAKLASLFMLIDDIFDRGFSTTDELRLFTSAIKRWEVSAIEQLPEYMKICYMALYNTVNEIAYKVRKEQGINILPYLEKSWVDTIEAFMIEAEWFTNGHEPSFEDYLENAVTRSGSYMALVHSYFLTDHKLNPSSMKMMVKPYPKLFSNSGKIIRLWDDFGTTKEEQERGDNASSIPLLMKEKNMASESEAREYIVQLIDNIWKEMNTELTASSTLPLPVIKACFNMAKTSQVIYDHQEDAYSSNVEKFINFILFEPISTMVDQQN